MDLKIFVILSCKNYCMDFKMKLDSNIAYTSEKHIALKL